MVIKEGQIVSDTDGKINRMSTPDFDVYYKGLLFVSGKRTGQQSIEYILTKLQKTGEFNFLKFFGFFFIYIVERKTGKQYVFTDNSGIFKAYCYNGCISTSFLELLDYSGELTIDNLDYRSISEFFHFGFTYFDNTLLTDIKRIDGDDFFIMENGVNLRKRKGIGTIDQASGIKVEDFFVDLIYAVEGKEVSLDITGGFDSRLILSFFIKAKSAFELAISGLAHNSDIRISKKNAAKIGKEFFPYFHSGKQLSIDEFCDIFSKTDSQLDIVDFNRNHRFNMERLSRGVEIQISGAGGELYKDFWWLQDFPFYNRKKTRLRNLYKLRIESTSFPHFLLGEKLMEYSLKLRETTILKLKSLLLKRNTESYDNIYFNYKMKTNAGVYISVTNNYFFSYAPLLEMELIRIGFNLKRKERFFNNFHRKLISGNCPDISTIETTEGTTASSSYADIIIDIFGYVIDKIKRLLKQLARKILKKTYFQESPTDNQVYEYVRNNPSFLRYVDLLKDHDILAFNVNINKLPELFIGRILTIGLLIERINNRNCQDK
ncbi:MAG: hypothetical protein M0Q26_15150 [Chitinophagaceae bacterium]|nr:hypothetical protein [Chitinophagaceae bacterium]